MYENLAFLGTGSCNENKTLIEILVVFAVIAGWAVILHVIRRINTSDKSVAFKSITISLLIGGGVFATALAAFSTWIGLTCSG